MPAKRLTKRPDGRFRRSLSYVDADGVKRRHYVYGSTQKEAAAKLKAAQERLDRGAPVKDASRTLTDWLTYWYGSGLAASDRAPKTKELHQQLTRSHVMPTIGDLTLDKLRPVDVQRLLVTMDKAGLSQNTRRNVYNALRAALDDAVLSGLLATNPVALVKRPAVPKSEARHLTPAEVKSFLSAIETSRNRHVLRFILATGVRRGEALGLKWSDLDWKRSEAKIRGTKTTESYRTIRLSKNTLAALEALKDTQEADRARAANLWQENGLVFPSALGTPLSGRNLLRTVQDASQRLGLEGVTVHTLRHTYATTALLNGVPLHVVSRNLGHSTINLTANIYGHLTDESAERAAESVTGALGL